MILLNTRPIEYAAQFAADFAACGLPTTESPVLRFESVGGWVDAPKRYDALIFTSPAAPRHRPADAAWNALPVYAVGPATAAAARAAGFNDVRQTGLTAVALAAALRREPFSRALYPSGEDVTLDLAHAFPGRVERSVVFRAEKIAALSPRAVSALHSPTTIFVPLFSRRSAEAFAELLSPKRRARVVALGISAAVLDLPQAAWDAALVAPIPTAPAMAAALVDHLRLQRRAA